MLELASPPTGEHFRFHTSAREHSHFGFTWTLAPGKTGPAEHVHPHESEGFTMVSGVLTVFMNGTERELHPGDNLVIPAGTPHRFHNRGDIPAVVEVALDGTRLEDQFIPMAWRAQSIANPTSLAELMRCVPHLVDAMAKEAVVPTSKVEHAMIRALGWIMERFGNRPLPIVTDWAHPTSDASSATIESSSSAHV